jgi:Ser/Thr protein kinase RdoA (MazF antagonist)
MLRNIYHLIKAFITGGEYEAVFEFEITWVDLLFFLVLLGLIIYLLWLQ